MKLFFMKVKIGEGVKIVVVEWSKEIPGQGSAYCGPYANPASTSFCK